MKRVIIGVGSKYSLAMAMSEALLAAGDASAMCQAAENTPVLKDHLYSTPYARSYRDPETWQGHGKRKMRRPK